MPYNFRMRDPGGEALGQALHSMDCTEGDVMSLPPRCLFMHIHCWFVENDSDFTDSYYRYMQTNNNTQRTRQKKLHYRY